MGVVSRRVYTEGSLTVHYIHAIDRSIFRYGWWIRSPEVPLLEVRCDVPAQEQPGPSPEEVRRQLPLVLPALWPALPPPRPLQGAPAEEALHGGWVHVERARAAIRELTTDPPRVPNTECKNEGDQCVCVVSNAALRRDHVVSYAALRTGHVVSSAALKHFT